MMRTYGRRVLVIGGGGYIGSALLPKLLARGYHVRLLDLLLFGIQPIAHVLKHPRLEILQHDFRCEDRVGEAMRGIDAVIHLGAIVGDPACALDEHLTVEVNLLATAMLAEAAKSAGVSRFLFASTCSVYGASNEILDECSLPNPISLYAQSKFESEKVLLQLADNRFAPVMLRFATIFGFSGRIRFDLVINLLTAKALLEGEITVIGGDQWRPFLHVDDAAAALLRALEAPPPLVHSQAFNVGSDQHNYTIQQAAEIVHRFVPAARVVTTDGGGDRRNYRVNFCKIRRVLRFAPRWTVERGIEQILQALQSGKIGDYHDARYSNAKFYGEQGVFLLRCHANGNGSAKENGHAKWNGCRLASGRAIRADPAEAVASPQRETAVVDVTPSGPPTAGGASSAAAIQTA